MTVSIQRPGTDEQTLKRWRQKITLAVQNIFSDYLTISSFQNLGPIFAGETGGTSTAYTASISPAPAALTPGLGVIIVMHVTNGSSPTLNLNGLGAKDLATKAGTYVSSTALQQYGAYLFVYDGARWLLVNA